MTRFGRICVFVGSSPGARPSYAHAAEALGRLFAARGITLVYGGAAVGLMKTLADSTLAAGGEVIGIIPQSLVDKEIAHPGISELRIVGSMHERKALMAELSDAFVAMPGGLGTLEEFFEVLTWAQLGYHKKPCGLLNVEGYYDLLLAFLDNSIAERLLRQENRDIIQVAAEAEALLGLLETYTPLEVDKWIDRPSQL